MIALPQLAEIGQAHLVEDDDLVIHNGAFRAEALASFTRSRYFAVQSRPLRVYIRVQSSLMISCERYHRISPHESKRVAFGRLLDKGRRQMRNALQAHALDSQAAIQSACAKIIRNILDELSTNRLGRGWFQADWITSSAARQKPVAVNGVIQLECTK
ncbi:hypothetical protein [Mesorhizobium sp. M7D.F.Ca.US.004.03.1.1]|uniref:hypothetical protein n=1 Tax=Mesorhizobium sp. M7D.F.Ca.US.004.03.1.1 TaxID=2496702 RepID=UPI0013E381B2|nr:hypothetical protein [Mesorhizobium sp. M7D.F.Ca.US.004.03.1.1]